jgi:hypothetical protein
VGEWPAKVDEKSDEEGERAGNLSDGDSDGDGDGELVFKNDSSDNVPGNTGWEV